MYEDRLKKVEKYRASIEKKKNVIIQKKKSLEKDGIIKLKSLFKKFNTELLKLAFEEVKESSHYSYHRNNTPDLIIEYADYKIKINNDGEIGSISDWYGFGQENRDAWHDYIILLGHFAHAMKNKKPIHSFFTKRFQKLGELHTDLEETIREYDTYKKETDDLIRSKKKCIISVLVKEGDRYEFLNGAYLNGYQSCTKIDVDSIKDKTYKCSVYGEKSERYGNVHGWYDTYVKHNDLHEVLLNRIDSLDTGFKRKFNLELTLTK